MAIFKRGINNKDFINTLNSLYSNKDSFWHKMVNDKELFIAIRNEYLNVYYNGQSICKLSYNNGSIEGLTHRKYLGDDNHGYFKSLNGKIRGEKARLNDLSEIEKVKQIVTTYFGKEKLQSYKEVLDKDKCVVDVEVSLVRNKVPNPQKRSDYEISSIDYLTLEGNKLTFYEAKHFSNPEIRSRTTPKVLNQISRYEQELSAHQCEIILSYSLVLQNLKELKILNAKSIPNKLEINLFPFLIVFGEENNKDNDTHIKKLRSAIGDRLILKTK